MMPISTAGFPSHYEERKRTSTQGIKPKEAVGRAGRKDSHIW